MNHKKMEFGTSEINDVFKDNSQFARFELGKPYQVEVLSSKITPREATFDGNTMTRYDINVKINNEEEKIWSVSKTVLKTISDNWEITKKFTVMRGDKSYSVIPIP